MVDCWPHVFTEVDVNTHLLVAMLVWNALEDGGWPCICCGSKNHMPPAQLVILFPPQ